MVQRSAEEQAASAPTQRRRSAAAKKAVVGQTDEPRGRPADNSARATPSAEAVRVLSVKILGKLAEADLTSEPSEADLEAIAAESVGLLTARLAHARNPLAERIGPTYRAEQLARYLPGVDAKPWTTEAIRKRAKKHQLVAFQSDDRVWLFPQWAFTVGVGRLVPIKAVTSTWQDLPHHGVLADVDLVAWMATRRRDLDGQTPARWATTHGYDDRLRGAVRSVRRRAA